MSDNVFGCSKEVLGKHPPLKEKHVEHNQRIGMNFANSHHEPLKVSKSIR